MSNTLISYQGENAYYNTDMPGYIQTKATVAYLNENCSNMFRDCKFGRFDFNSFNFKYVKNMSHMFYNACVSPRDDEPMYIDLSNIIDMSYAFALCKTGQRLIFTNCYNINNQANMNGIYDQSAIRDAFCPDNSEFLNLNNIYEGTNVVNAACSDYIVIMDNSYRFCHQLEKAACGNNVESMYYTYFNCDNLKEAACGSNVVHMDHTYAGCLNLRTAVLGEKLTTMEGTYLNCYNLENIIYKNLNSLNSMISTFSGCNNLSFGIIPYNCNLISYYGNTYSECTNIETIDFIYSSDTNFLSFESVKHDFYGTFANCYLLKNFNNMPPAKNNISRIRIYDSTFFNCRNLNFGNDYYCIGDDIYSSSYNLGLAYCNISNVIIADVYENCKDFSMDKKCKEILKRDNMANIIQHTNFYVNNSAYGNIKNNPKFYFGVEINFTQTDISGEIPGLNYINYNYANNYYANYNFYYNKSMYNNEYNITVYDSYRSITPYKIN